MQFAELIENVPRTPGVYQMYDAAGTLLYVGKAKNLYNRLHQYVNTDKLSYHIKLMRRQVSRIEVITTATESDALVLESDFIKNKRPRYNILLTDDKMYPMLALSGDEFPRIYKFRGRAVPKRDVFGPYPSVGALNESIKLIQRVCKIRTCTNSFMNNRTRPCLLHQIGRCSAPCMTNRGNPDYISKPAYDASVNDARRVLNGNTAPVIRELSSKMQTASDNLEFETAARIRDQITSLSDTAGRGRADTRSADFFVADFSNGPVIAIARMRNGQWISHQIIRPKQTNDMTHADIMAQTVLWFYSENKPVTQIITNVKMPLLETYHSAKVITRENDAAVKTLLAQIDSNNRTFGKTELKWANTVSLLGEWLGINVERADVFDNSHLFGKNPVGAMIVFGRNGFSKKDYRHFKLENSDVAGNDIGMMAEFLHRTYAKVNETDGRLLIVDGGPAQWNIAKKVLNDLNLNIPVLGVTKGMVRDGDEHFIKPDGSVDTSLPKDSPLFLMLRAVRDEAHRFAITFHRKTRAKSAITSALDEIEGIGASRKRALLHHFGSVAQVANADVNSLSRVSGISKSVAEKIYSYFHADAV